MLDTTTGEVVTRRLEHENGEARAFYNSLAGPVRVGIERGLHAVVRADAERAGARTVVRGCGKDSGAGGAAAEDRQSRCRAHPGSGQAGTSANRLRWTAFGAVEPIPARGGGGVLERTLDRADAIIEGPRYVLRPDGCACWLRPQILVFPSVGSRARSVARPHRLSCSTPSTTAYSMALDHLHSSALFAKPRRARFR